MIHAVFYSTDALTLSHSYTRALYQVSIIDCRQILALLPTAVLVLKDRAFLSGQSHVSTHLTIL